MAFLPVGANRIPTLLNQTLALDNLLRRQQALTQASLEASTGRRIQLPSDDPAAASNAEFLQQLRERKEQLLSNIQSGETALAQTEIAMRAVETAVDRVRSILILANNDATSDLEVQAEVVNVNSIIDELLSVSDNRVFQRFAFAGHRTDARPFEYDGNEIVFNGDNQLIESFRDLDILFPANVTAGSSFGTDSAAGRSGDLSPNITVSTRLADLNGGLGVNRGQVVIDDGASGPVLVDLSTADSIQDVIDVINNDPVLGATVTAALNAAGNGLSVTSSAGNITITEANGGTTARDLGIRADGTAATVVGGDLDPAIAATTPVSVLLDGTIGALGSIQIDNGPHSAAIDLSAAATVEDVLNTINSAGVRVRAEINADGTGINVVSVLSGAEFSITETTPAGTTAQRLDILTTNFNTPLDDFNGGGGVFRTSGPDISLTTRDGTNYLIDLDAAQTVGDLRQIIESDTAGAVTVDLNPQGGIRLTDNTGGGGNFIVADVPASTAATNLGIAADIASATILGTNNHQARVKGIFDTLLRLRDALTANDRSEFAKIFRQLEEDSDRILRANGEVGNTLQVLDISSQRIDKELIDVEDATAQSLERDFTEIITNLVNQQNALQAALESTSRLLQGSLLDFI